MMKADSKSLIRETVLDLLQSTSIFEISISRLKKETGLSTGTVYYHYPGGIEDVFCSIFIELASELREELFSEAEAEKSFKSTLEKIISFYFSWHQREVRKSTFFFSLSAAGIKDLRNLLISEFSVFSSGIYKLLVKRAQQEGIKLVRPVILDAILFGATRELVHSWINRGRDENEFEDLQSDFIKTIYRSCVESIETIENEDEV